MRPYRALGSLPLALSREVSLCACVISPCRAGAPLRFRVSRAGPRPPSRSGWGPRPFPSPPAPFTRSLRSLVFGRALRAALAALAWESGISGRAPAAFCRGRSLRSRPLQKAAGSRPSPFFMLAPLALASPRGCPLRWLPRKQQQPRSLRSRCRCCLLGRCASLCPRSSGKPRGCPSLRARYARPCGWCIN